MAGGNVGRGEDSKTLREYNSLHRPTKPNMLLNQSLTIDHNKSHATYLQQCCPLIRTQ